MSSMPYIHGQLQEVAYFAPEEKQRHRVQRCEDEKPELRESQSRSRQDHDVTNKTSCHEPQLLSPSRAELVR